ncbi:MAG: methyl-accepting chemotaxis protein, partial [Rhodoferax sp.]
MSVVDQLKNLFTKKQSESELDSRLSLAMPEDSVNVAGAETVQDAPAATATESAATPGEPAVNEPAAPVNEGDLISIPGLGQRTVVQHQRTLSIL